MPDDPPKRKLSSHALFFTVLFMSTLIVGTILLYFFVLPKTAPKQLHVAVLPFSGPDAIDEYLKVGFAADLRDSLALSRDALIVDFRSSMEVVSSEAAEAQYPALLDVTHVVVGDWLPVRDAEFELTIRVVNVSHPTWKEAEKISKSVSTNRLEQLRSDLTVEIRHALYDNSEMRTLPVEGTTESYRSYLEALTAWLGGRERDALVAVQSSLLKAETAYARYLNNYLLVLDLTASNQLQPIDIKGIYPNLTLQRIEHNFNHTRDFPHFVETLENFVSEYPNSRGVLRLAEAYEALHWFEAAELLYLRWASINPRDASAALNVGALRAVTMDFDGAHDAVQIARRRALLDRHAGYRIAAYSLASGASNLTETPDPRILLRMKSLEDDLDSAKRIFATIEPTLTCDERVELLLYLGDIEAVANHLYCTIRFWTTPPPFANVTGLASWPTFIDSRIYADYVLHYRLVDEQLLERGPIAPAALFAPRRS